MGIITHGNAVTSNGRTGNGLSRRDLVGLISASPLAGLLGGCGFESSPYSDIPYTLRNHVTFKIGGQVKSATSDVFQRYTDKTGNQPYGEATILPLGNGRRAYQLMVDSERKYVFPLAVNFVFGGFPYTGSEAIPILTQAQSSERDTRIAQTPAGARGLWDFRGYHASRQTRVGQDIFRSGFPFVVAFRDERKPETIFQIDTEKPSRVFGRQFEYESWEIERLSDGSALSDEITEHLLWADKAHPFWDGKAFDSMAQPPSMKLKEERRAANRPTHEHKSKLPYQISRRYFKNERNL